MPSMVLGRSLAHARELAERVQKKMAKFKEESETHIQYGLQGAEVSGTALGLGYANARWGGPNGAIEVAGLPIDMSLGITMHMISFLGGLGEYREHGHNVADGAMAAFSYRMGMQLGRESKAQQPQQPAQPQPAQPPLVSGVAGQFGEAPEGRRYTVLEHDLENAA
jgi:hypothetical protein